MTKITKSDINEMLMNEFKDRLLMLYGDDDYVKWAIKQHKALLTDREDK
tara:strand:- start:662 stop:808 length:147 start_codon:yes stop_codon:yes gene_type:complete